MPADNIDEVTNAVQTIIILADKSVELHGALTQYKAEMDSSGQVWSELYTDFPKMFQDANGNDPDGNALPTPTQQDRIILGTVWQNFNGAKLQQCKDGLDKVLDALEGTVSVAIDNDRLKDIRKVATKTGIS